MAYPISPSEPERLAALQSLHILDTSAEISFDILTNMARRHFRVPIAVISLVDEHRQWFKSHPGLDACSTDREVAFCNYTILTDDIFEVSDAKQDTVFRNNPLVTGYPNIGYYGGAPITARGQRIGAFCIIDHEKRPAMEPNDRQTLLDLAYLTAHIIVSDRLLRESAGSLSLFLRQD